MNAIASKKSINITETQRNSIFINGLLLVLFLVVSVAAPWGIDRYQIEIPSFLTGDAVGACLFFAFVLAVALISLLSHHLVLMRLWLGMGLIASAVVAYTVTPSDWPEYAALIGPGVFLFVLSLPLMSWAALVDDIKKKTAWPLSTFLFLLMYVGAEFLHDTLDLPYRIGIAVLIVYACLWFSHPNKEFIRKLFWK